MGGPLIFVLVLACIHLLVSGRPSDVSRSFIAYIALSTETQDMIAIQHLAFLNAAVTEA